MPESMERFTELMEDYSSLGKWRISRVGSRSYDDVLKAALYGVSGRVEVWGGNLHRREVWCIGKDGKETLVAIACHGEDLSAAISQACKLAGIQTRMVFAYA